jgi:hypothetical protein
VQAPPQAETALHRVILFASHGEELLVLPGQGRFRLPDVSIPPHQRVAQELTASLCRDWSQVTVSLFRLDASSTDSETRYQVMESTDAYRSDAAALRRVSLPSLRDCQFEQSADAMAVARAIAKCKEYAAGSKHGPFGRLGWFPELTEWVRDQIRSAGLFLNGRFRQLNASPTFSLVRFETNGPALWFKAAGEPNLHECRITLKLASAFPDFVPRIVASRPEWNAWLAFESAGCQLDANASESAWTTAAENLALLQISSFGRFELISAGCKDLRPCLLLELVDPFLDAMAEWMEQQTKIAPAPLSRQELVSLGSNITSALKEMGDSKIPSALGHLDMNPGNLLVCGAHCVFLDWAEGYVGPPFFSFQYLLEHWRQLYGGDSRHEPLLHSSYARHWTRLASPQEITAAFRAVPLLAAFAYAAGSIRWRNRECVRPETARYLRSLTRRMKQEADDWAAGRRELSTGFRGPEPEAR